MKIIKRLIIGLVALVVLLFVVAAAFISLVDLNDYKDKIQNLTKSETGRDLAITGDLNVSYFPWVGITLGELSFSNAEGFGDAPFARIDSANVKVELLPLLRKTVNVKTVELKGLSLDLQRAADGTTNWDDLSKRSPTTTTTTENNTTTEVEGDAAAIAALAVGGVDIENANISWLDQQSGTDAKLSSFALKTGRIELATPFEVNTSFKVNSDSAGIAADVEGGGNINIDLDSQRYSVKGFTLKTALKGETLPNGELDATFLTDVIADLADQTVNADSLKLTAMGLTLNGKVSVVDLDTKPQISATLESDSFDPSALMQQLAIEAPVTADAGVLKSASLSVAVEASPESAEMKELTIKLDDTTFKGSANLPNLAAAMPPVRFDFDVDAIDLDRYLPPTVEDAAGEGTATETEAEAETAPAADTPIELPMDLLRELDVDGTFSVGELKIMNLTTRNIDVPLKAAGGVIALENIAASLYDGTLASTMTLNATQAVPAYAVTAVLDKVESDPLLADLQQGKSPLTGNANFSADITTSGDSVNALKRGLNGGFKSAFLDGSLNGINIGYQIRRAKAALQAKKLTDEEKSVKTDFSSLSMSGVFKDGVLTSDDLDMRSPLLRLGGAGTVDLNKEYLDYTPNLKITGSAEGQGGKDLDDLKGVQLDLLLQGTFAEISADPAGFIIASLKNSFTGMAKAQLKAKADEAKAALRAKEAELKEKLDAEKAAAEAELQEKIDAEKADLKEKAKDKLKGSLNKLLK